MWIQISSGKGPAECELAVSLFLKAYQAECQQQDILTTLIEAVAGDKTGNFKSVLLALETATQTLNPIPSGSILWICRSPYRPHQQRKNWFIDLEVFQAPAKLKFELAEVKFEAFCSPGPGGQNVNKVASAVRAIHLPTGLTVTASEERSQYLNKKLAVARLSKLIETQNQAVTMQDQKKRWLKHQQLKRGNPVRIYEGEQFKLKR